MNSPHSFHIPVMGTGFTVDAPLKVARFGISTVVPLVDDHLIESIHRYYCRQYGEEWDPPARSSGSLRAARITAYLNFVHRTVARQIGEIRAGSFTPGSDITRYFELLDDASELKAQYHRMLKTRDLAKRAALEQELRDRVVPGAVNVNIMTKLDRRPVNDAVTGAVSISDAEAALRGFAESAGEGSVVFSAGMNPALFTYLTRFEGFFENEKRIIRKKVTLKVSDFRSAQVQGKVLARKGIWVSEYRVESGIHCGGHAFPSKGFPLGMILEEFRSKRAELVSSLFGFYREALRRIRGSDVKETPEVRITAQGGVSSNREHRFLRRHYGLNSVGWATPFLLVPEVTAVDEETLKKLEQAGPDDVYLSGTSPLGIPFYQLRNSDSEIQKRRRVEAGSPGAPCRNGYAALDTEFPGDPLCWASSRYQQLKLKQLEQSGLDEDTLEAERRKVVDVACLCYDLGCSAQKKYGLGSSNEKLTPAVCPGPNIALYRARMRLEDLVGHIYGRRDLLKEFHDFRHVFLTELRLYIDYFKKRFGKDKVERDSKEGSARAGFLENLTNGIQYYKQLADALLEESQQDRRKFFKGIEMLEEKLRRFVQAEVVTV